MTGARAACLGILVWTLVFPRVANGQAEGSIAGRVLDMSGAGLSQAQVLVDEHLRALSDTAGVYRARGIRSGWHRISARLIGYRSVVQDSVFVGGGTTVMLDFSLEINPLQLSPLVVTAPLDPVLDPLATATEQKITAEDLRQLPVSSLEEAIALSAGSVGQSYRGGRLGEESFILDGLGVKNQLDASTGGLGVRLPPDALSEASLVTNAFSARYGQALSGMVNVVTKEPGESWLGRLAYETDRPLGGTWDFGLDRLVAQGDGPIFGRVGLLAAVDLGGRLDADPVNAPAPTDARDPRSQSPSLLPHNSGEQLSALGKLTVPLNERFTVRLLGLHSEDQSLLYDPAYKYDLTLAPAQRLKGDLLTGHVQYMSSPNQGKPLIVDLRVSRFSREFGRGTLSSEVDYAFGGITGERFHFVGEDLAKSQTASPTPIPGLRGRTSAVRHLGESPRFL
jgi:hypothetical protein